jgi:hypothetical protein
MKQFLSLFLFLLPCLALAQYPSNGNQKITLGEQTTADGLIWRGVLGDTALITPLSDTSAYIILDTANHRFYNYNRATNVWSVAGGGTAVTTFSAGTTGLTPSTATSGAVTLAGTLAVANGGTGQTTLAAAGINTGSGTINFIPKYTATGTTLGNSAISDNGTTITATNRSIYNTGNNNFIRVGNYFNIGGSGSDYGSIGFNIGYTTTNDTYKYLFGDLSSAIKFNGGGFNFFTAPSGITDSTIIYTERMRITNAGNVGIATTNPTEKLHVVGNGLFTGNVGIGSATPATSGSGITFPATQSASTNPNTLDDYEEGTWTTTFGAKVNLTGTPSLSSAIYRKIGQIVYIEGRVGGLTITTSNTTTYIIFSVPIAMNNNSTSQIGNVYTYTGSTDMSGIITDNTSGDNTTVAIIIPKALVTAGSLSDLLFSITYIANN